MELLSVKLDFPEGANIILGQSHFVKTIEDLYEIMATHCSHAKFGLAFSEASLERLIRSDGNDEDLRKKAIENLEKIAAGHCFMIIMQDVFPISVLNAIKSCQEVCSIFCATANPVEVILARTENGGAILGVVDGFSPIGVEAENDIERRRMFIRKITKYKR